MQNIGGASKMAKCEICDKSLNLVDNLFICNFKDLGAGGTVLLSLL